MNAYVVRHKADCPRPDLRTRTHQAGRRPIRECANCRRYIYLDIEGIPPGESHRPDTHTFADPRAVAAMAERRGVPMAYYDGRALKVVRSVADFDRNTATTRGNNS